MVNLRGVRIVNGGVNAVDLSIRVMGQEQEAGNWPIMRCARD